MSNIYTIKEGKITNIILILIYRILLDLSYIVFINPVYSYEGFVFKFNSLKMLESYFFVFITSSLLPQNNKLPSNIVMNILNLIMIIPIYSIFAFKNESRIYAYSVFVSFNLGIIIIRLFPKITYKVKFSFNKFINLFIVSVTVIVYVILIYFNGLPKLALLNFNNVYIVRSTINYGFPIMTYLVSWLGIVINPYLVITFYKRNNKLMLFFVIFSQIILYLLTSQKSFLFYPILLVIILYLLYRKDFIKYTILGVTAIVVLSMLVYFLARSSFIPRLTIYRTLYLPAQISFQFYEFFSKNGLVYLSHSIFEPFFTKPIYDTHPIEIIGQIYYYNNFPNTGYLGDAYMNFGITGMIVYSILLSFILKLIDGLAENDEKVLTACAFTGVLSIQLSNTGLLTTLLTGGLIVFIMLLWIFKYDDCTI
ncbi:MAG: O-antigen polymerase [Sedimentibacter sp.]